MALNDADRRVLDIASRDYRALGSLDQAAHDELSMSASRFWQRANALMDDPEAWREFPLLVKRLRRLRDAKQVDREVRRKVIAG